MMEGKHLAGLVHRFVILLFVVTLAFDEEGGFLRDEVGHGAGEGV